MDEKPAYRKDWDLAENTNFEAGVIYMAQMNPKEPAAVEMLGVAAWQKRDYHLAVSAFEKAMLLGSPQSGLLRTKIDGIRTYIAESERSTRSINNELLFTSIVSFFVFSLPLFAIWYVYRRVRNWRRNQAMGK